jgi:hypothetical protein
MVAYCRSAYGADKTRENLWQKELNLYKEARDAGIQPDGTGLDKIRFAMDQSEKHGMRYGTDFNVAPNEKGGLDAVSHEMVAKVTAEIDKSSDMQLIRETAHGG